MYEEEEEAAAPTQQPITTTILEINEAEIQEEQVHIPPTAVTLEIEGVDPADTKSEDTEVETTPLTKEERKRLKDDMAILQEGYYRCEEKVKHFWTIFITLLCAYLTLHSLLLTLSATAQPTRNFCRQTNILKAIFVALDVLTMFALIGTCRSYERAVSQKVKLKEGYMKKRRELLDDVNAECPLGCLENEQRLDARAEVALYLSMVIAISILVTTWSLPQCDNS